MNTIEIIGLGAGDINQLPLGIYRKLMEYKGTVYVRTADHPVVGALQMEGVHFTSFDEIYKAEEQFIDVYEQIVSTLLEKATGSSIIYAVPGHPMLAEKSVQLLLEQSDVNVSVIGGQSYLDALFTTLKIDPIDGFQFVNAATFNRRELDYRHHLVFCQVYDAFTASEVKLSLLEDLPADYEVTIVEAAGSENEQIRNVPLEQLDHHFQTNNLISVYVPPVPDNLLNHTFNRLKEIISTLRGPNGCPWDKKQTHESLREYGIEEVFELIEAIDTENDEGIVEELGDLLLQVMLHSQIGEDDGYFTIDDVIGTITNKMIHRHPHVFADTTVQSIDDVYKNWDALKKEEKGDARQSVLDGVPKQLPALAKAYKLQIKAAKAGFQWHDVTNVWEKLDEELQEVHEAIEIGNSTELEKEFGDVLFVLANLTRYYKINPEIALNRACEKFISRFSYIEEQLIKDGKSVQESSLKEMDNYWNEAKERE